MLLREFGARMEWIKLRSLRSAWWTFGIPGTAAVGFGVVVGLTAKNAAGGLINDVLSGAIAGLLMAGAEAGVFGEKALAAGEAAAFLLLGGVALRHGIAAPTPGVPSAIMSSGASFCLIDLVGFGLGLGVRRTAAAVAVLAGAAQCREFLTATDGLLVLCACAVAVLVLTVGGWMLAPLDA